MTSQPAIQFTDMKLLLTAAAALIFLNSCVFESPFEADAKIAAEAKLLGKWDDVSDSADGRHDRMLVLQHSANEYLVEYPLGEKAMVFRAYAVEMAGGKYVQVQLIGTADGPVKPEDRKYHLLKIRVDEDALEMSTVNPEVFGKPAGDSARMKATFEKHKDDPKLFGEPVKFRRIK